MGVKLKHHNNTHRWPIGVFASVDDGLGVHWDVLRELRVPTIHLHAPSKRYRSHDEAKKLRERLEAIEVQVTAVFGAFAGDDYSTIRSARETVGLVPMATRGERTAEMKEIAEFASWMDCPVAALHLGFIPPRASDPLAYDDLVAVTRSLADDCASRRQSVHLETGQESADELIEFMNAVDRDNLFVNFDPANMILYGTGDPLPAIRQLGHRVHSVHCKDAKWSETPGATWGQEVPAGDGDVDFPQFMQILLEIGYQGPLTIEREIPHLPEQQLREIGQTVSRLHQWQAELPL